MIRSPTFSPAAETTTPPRTSGSAAPRPSPPGPTSPASPWLHNHAYRRAALSPSRFPSICRSQVDGAVLTSSGPSWHCRHYISLTAVLEFGPTETLPPVGAISKHPASLPTRSPLHPPRPARKAGFSTFESGCGRETDCLLEGTRFEPSVPPSEPRLVASATLRFTFAR